MSRNVFTLSQDGKWEMRKGYKGEVKECRERLWGVIDNITISKDGQYLGILLKGCSENRYSTPDGVIMLSLDSSATLHLLLLLDMLYRTADTVITFKAYMYDRKGVADISAFVDYNRSSPEEPKWIKHPEFMTYRNRPTALAYKVIKKFAEESLPF